MQSWESGRRPFTAVPFGQTIATRQRLGRLGRLGANTTLLAALDDAAEADFILTAVLDEQIERTDVAEQPLGWSVLTHRLTDLVLWGVLGRTPTFVRSLPTPHQRRGPVATAPLLPADQRRAFFAPLHVLAERSGNERHPNVLLHRQACFLAGMDPTGASAAWLAEGNGTPFARAFATGQRHLKPLIAHTALPMRAPAEDQPCFLRTIGPDARVWHPSDAAGLSHRWAGRRRRRHGVDLLGQT